MNYLAHAFLSPNIPSIRTGNLIGDFVKKNQIQTFDKNIQIGLNLHRTIDQFTDKHDLVQQAISLLKPEFPLSAGIFTDILFDHFLANDSLYFASGDILKNFTQKVYADLQEHRHIMNDSMLEFFHYMKKYDWLYHYKYQEGLSKSIHGICKRVPRLGDPTRAMNQILLHYEALQSLYKAYFPELQHEIMKHYR